MTSWFQGAQVKGPGFQGDAPAEQRNTVEALKEVAELVMKLRSPDGSKEAPGITCRDIALAHPSFKSGLYWINPNGGSISDRIQVWCKMRAEATQTCLEESTFKFESNPWDMDVVEDGVHNFAASNLEQGMFDYSSDMSQIRALKMKTNQGKQKVILTSKTEVDQKNVILTNFKEDPVKSKRFNVKVKDACTRGRGNCELTFDISGKGKLMHLPIRDLGFKEVIPELEFGVKVNRACFWEGGSKSRK